MPTVLKTSGTADEVQLCQTFWAHKLTISYFPPIYTTDPVSYRISSYKILQYKNLSEQMTVKSFDDDALIWSTVACTRLKVSLKQFQKLIEHLYRHFITRVELYQVSNTIAHVRSVSI